MQVTVEANSKLERTVTVAVPEDKIASEVENRLRHLSQTSRIQGFRPGKAPYKLIRQRFGEQIRQEVVGMVLQSSLNEAITQESLRPAGSPEIGKLDAEQGKGLSYTAKFEVFPEIQINPVEELKIEKAICEITDKDTDKMIDILRNQHYELKVVDRASRGEDIVEVDYKGFIGGEPFAGGDAANFKIDLSKKRLLEGFEAGLIGKNAGEEVILNLQFPDTYHVKEIAGKPAEFKVKIGSVNEKVPPELNDEFYKTFGVENGGLEAFRKQIKDQMEREAGQVLRNRLRESIMKALQAANTVELPKVMVAHEKHRLRHQFEHNLKAQGLKSADVQLPDDDGIFEERARNRVTLQLLVGELIRLNNIKVDAEKVRQTVMQYAENYQDPAALLNWYYNDKERMAEIEAVTLENQIIDWIAERAKVTNLNLTFDECMNKGQTESD